MRNTNIKKYIFAKRGLQLKYPENTIEAYKQAEQQNFAIHIDVRTLKNGNIICFKDRYMKRLFGIPGRIYRVSNKFLKKQCLLESNIKVPSFKEVIKNIKRNYPLLLELNGYFSSSKIKELVNLCEKNHRDTYFCSSSIINYIKLKKIINNKNNVYFLSKIFGINRNIQFFKSDKYNKIDFIPAFDDIIVEAEDKVQNIIRKLHKTFNEHTTRVTANHWLLKYNGKKYQIRHRCISNKNVREHSKEAILNCIEKDKIPEIDVVMYKGNIICYHSDKISSKLGQEASIAEKLRIENSLLFKDMLKLIDGKAPIVIDIKDHHLKNRNLEIMLVKELENYKGEYCIQSYNPLVLRWFLKKYPNIIRGQIGNSLSSLKRSRNIVLAIVNFLLFYSNKADYIVYNLDKYVGILSRFNSVLGLPVIGYTAFCNKDIKKYEGVYFDNIIIEGDFID